MILFNNKILSINGEDHLLDFQIYEMSIYNDQVVVLFHPDEGLNMQGQFPNLVCFAFDGHKKWTADLPTSNNGDVYYKIVSKNPLIVNSMQSYQCQIDIGTGKILKRDFYK